MTLSVIPGILSLGTQFTILFQFPEPDGPDHHIKSTAITEEDNVMQTANAATEGFNLITAVGPFTPLGYSYVASIKDIVRKPLPFSRRPQIMGFAAKKQVHDNIAIFSGTRMAQYGCTPANKYF